MKYAFQIVDFFIRRYGKHEALSDGEEFHMKKILTQYGVCALAGTATARAPDAGCTLPSEGFPCLHACPSRYRLGSRQ